jgi:hypothetical protein
METMSVAAKTSQMTWKPMVSTAPTATSTVDAKSEGEVGNMIHQLPLFFEKKAK